MLGKYNGMSAQRMYILEAIRHLCSRGRWQASAAQSSKRHFFTRNLFFSGFVNFLQSCRTSEFFFALFDLLLAKATCISADGVLDFFLHLDVKSFGGRLSQVSRTSLALEADVLDIMGPSVFDADATVNACPIRPVSKPARSIDSLQFLAYHGSGQLSIEPFLQLHLLCIRDSACEGKRCILKTRK
jgi:hypothetical protein